MGARVGIVARAVRPKLNAVVDIGLGQGEREPDATAICDQLTLGARLA